MQPFFHRSCHSSGRDVWAFDLTQSKAEEVFYSLTLVQRRRPPVILFVMKKQLWKGFIKEHIFQLQEYGYHITHKNIQSSEVTAFPLREEFAYIVSKRVNASDMIMPVQVHKSSILLDGWGGNKSTGFLVLQN